MNILCFLIPVLVGLISALLGYWLGQLKSGGNTTLQSNFNASLEENSKLSHKNSLLENDLIVAKSSLQNDLDTCKANATKLNATIASLQAELDLFKTKGKSDKSASSDKAAVTTKKAVVKKAPVKKAPVKKAPAKKASTFDGALAKTVFGKRIKLDDLKIVEGIGPKIEGLYNAAGIKTWKALSETSLEKSQAILDAAGSRYAIHNPATWAKQSLLAFEGKWQELKDWQDSMSGGKA
jgi:predicted flap endonuclease-1-like 5' DNA nuclease